MGKKIHNVDWFNTPNGCIGIVLHENEFGEKHAYIKQVPGLVEAIDIADVADWGAKIHVHQAKRIAEFLKTEE
tara:strand:+ start:216564 stop:216782 length:219 start_codon:yes stop_codon:yes gene_type:complete